MSTPIPDSIDRIRESCDRRERAANLAANRMVAQITESAEAEGDLKAASALPTRTNGEERLVEPVTAFHKGLPHTCWGIPVPKAFAVFRDALRRPVIGGYAPFDVPIGPVDARHAHRPMSLMGSTAVDRFTTVKADGSPPEVRAWESPLGGHQFDLEGADPAALAMAPAPTLGSDELTAEMADVYAMALLRDVHVAKLETDGEDARGGATVGAVRGALKQLWWFDPKVEAEDLRGGDAVSAHRPLYDHEVGRRRNTPFVWDGAQIFRGSTEGARSGPYVSQFLLIGGPELKDAEGGVVAGGLCSGRIPYGRQTIDQRVRVHRAGIDHMTDWPLWLDVQNGADVKGQDYYEDDPRYIGTLRDLATFVHFDELHQAYFNAALLLASYGVPFDVGLPSGKLHATRDSFATFGAGQLLSLLPEVANRGLKAVRRQKFQHHLRGRPEQLAAMLTLTEITNGGTLGTARTRLEKVRDTLKETGLLGWIAKLNQEQNARRHDEGFFPQTDAEAAAALGIHSFGHDGQCDAPPNYLLPMAFPEGSPMHASYGAGHATVAGACVTVLKAFFEMSQAGYAAIDGLKEHEKEVKRPLDPLKGSDVALEDAWWMPAPMSKLKGLENACAQQANEDRTDLEAAGVNMCALSIEGELDKLAANISIGRNMAGVHFYTDYYDSLRMGERVAVGLLHEQMLTYTDPVSMRFTSFDGDRVLITGDGGGEASVRVARKNCSTFEDYLEEWWTRHAGAEYPRGPVDAMIAAGASPVPEPA